MSDKTKIEWTNATWNPVRGCSLVSAGCTNCYAMRQAHRQKNGAYRGLTRLGPNGPVWTGDVRFIPEAVDYPLRLKKPHMIFVNSMSDLFHEALSDYQIDRVFAVISLAQRHTFQVLTKRPERMLAYFSDPYHMNRTRSWVYSIDGHRARHEPAASWPLSNVWLGVSVEDQKTADERIPLLLQTPAAVRWISAEPLLGPVDLGVAVGRKHGAEYHDKNGPCTCERDKRLDWVVVGGESGAGARPMRVEWAHSLIHQCQSAGVPVFMKQVGRWPSGDPDEFVTTGDTWANKDETDGGPILKSRKGGDIDEWPRYLRVREFPATTEARSCTATT